MKILLFIFMIISLSLSSDYRKDFIDIRGKQIYEYFLDTEYKDVTDIIVAMAILESSWGRSRWHNNHKNLFSIMMYQKDIKMMTLRKFNNYEDAIVKLHSIFTKKGYRTDITGFYEDLVIKYYAEDPKYIHKLKQVVKFKADIN